MSSLFQELKRRKVFRVAVAYAVVAWVLIQISGEVLPALQMPDWTISFVTVLLLLGFPVALLLGWAFELTPDGVKADTGAVSPPNTTSNTDRKLIYATFILVLLVAGFQIVDRFMSDPQTNAIASNINSSSIGSASSQISNLSRRSFLNLGVTMRKRGEFGTSADIAVSPDGRRLAFSVFTPGAPSQIFLQELDQIGAQLLPGTEDGRNPFFSPDGEWIGFWQDGLKRLSVRGGQPLALADSMRVSTSGFWSPDDTIYYTSDAVAGRRLQRIAAAGGTPGALEVGSEDTDLVQYWPHPLPNGDGLLFSVLPTSGERTWHTDLLTLSSSEVRTLIQNGYNARYVPTGHIVFIRTGSLWAVPFDLDRMEIVGMEVPVVQGVQTDEAGPGDAVYAFSNDGLLVYLPADDSQNPVITRSLLWVDRDGNEEPLSLTRNFIQMALSPDGESVAVSIRDPEQSSIWIFDLIRNSLSRLTFDEFSESDPMWTPDGERIVFSSARTNGRIWWKAANGTGQEVPLISQNQLQTPNAFTPDGTQLVYVSAGDIYLQTLNTDAPPKPLIQGAFIERRADISPDGKFIAYQSDETGRFEVYVRPFPDVDAGKWQVSNEGGERPKWNPEGGELFFRGPQNIDFENSFWAVQVDTENDFQYDIPDFLFSGNYRRNNISSGYDVSPDGTRFLLSRDLLNDNSTTASELTQLIVVDNWFEELKRLAPPDPQ